jgi:hypothetical protein
VRKILYVIAGGPFDARVIDGNTMADRTRIAEVNLYKHPHREADTRARYSALDGGLPPTMAFSRAK